MTTLDYEKIKKLNSDLSNQEKVLKKLKKGKKVTYQATYLKIP